MPISISTTRTNLRRALFAGLGILSTVLGVIGVIVPGLPGTVFVIAASYLFARSSPALDRWLRRNRWLGPSLQRFAETRGMTRGSKALALASTWTELALGWYALAAFGPGIRILIIVMGAIGTATLLFVVRTAPTAGHRHAPLWGRYRIASAARLLVEPGLLICVTSPVSARESRSLKLAA